MFLLTIINRLFPLYHTIDDFHTDGSHEQGASYRSTRFDLMTFSDYNITTFTDDDGKAHRITGNERSYVSSEITWMLTSLGFHSVEKFGAKHGACSRNVPLTTKDFELLATARK